MSKEHGEYGDEYGQQEKHPSLQKVGNIDLDKVAVDMDGSMINTETGEPLSSAQKKMVQSALRNRNRELQSVKQSREVHNMAPSLEADDPELLPQTTVIESVEPELEDITPDGTQDDTVMDDNQQEEERIQRETNTDPATARMLANMPQRDDFVIGAFMQNGEVFVFADGTDPFVMGGRDVRNACYAHRFSMGMAQAGIENFGTSLVPTDGSAKPAIILDESKWEGKKVYRSIFKLKNPII